MTPFYNAWWFWVLVTITSPIWLSFLYMTAISVAGILVSPFMVKTAIRVAKQTSIDCPHCFNHCFYLGECSICGLPKLLEVKFKNRCFKCGELKVVKR